MRTNDGRVSHPFQDIVVSIIVIAMVTMLILPGSPATEAIKAFGGGMAGAIKNVVGRTS